MHRRPSTLPLVICAMAILIVVVGGTIRIHDAGESCPDWPQCFGTWGFNISEDEQQQYWEDHPDEIDSRGEDHRYTVFEIFVEWFHRLLVGIIAIPIALNVVLMHKLKHIYGKRVFTVSVVAAILLVIQAIAGMITVVFDNEDWTVALHLSLASIFTSLFIFQFMEMSVREGKRWSFIRISASARQHLRIDIIRAVVAIGILLVLGAWVSSTSGGEYNKACSVGFPDGWPQCQGDFFPAINENGTIVAGVLIQMIHRIGAIFVGFFLILAAAKIREYVRVQDESAQPVSTMFEITTGIWLLNVLIGGMYIIFAKADEFPELLSLLHLVVGVSVFLAALVSYFMISIHPVDQIGSTTTESSEEE